MLVLTLVLYSAQRTIIPDSHLGQICENLTAAERAHRRADSDTVYDAYEKLANYFRENSDFKTAIYFYEKCLDIAESVDNLSQQVHRCTQTTVSGCESRLYVHRVSVCACVCVSE